MRDHSEPFRDRRGVFDEDFPSIIGNGDPARHRAEDDFCLMQEFSVVDDGINGSSPDNLFGGFDNERTGWPADAGFTLDCCDQCGPLFRRQLYPALLLCREAEMPVARFAGQLLTRQVVVVHGCLFAMMLLTAARPASASISARRRIRSRSWISV